MRQPIIILFIAGPCARSPLVVYNVYSCLIWGGERRGEGGTKEEINTFHVLLLLHI